MGSARWAIREGFIEEMTLKQREGEKTSPASTSSKKSLVRGKSHCNPESGIAWSIPGTVRLGGGRQGWWGLGGLGIGPQLSCEPTWGLWLLLWVRWEP